MHRIDDHALVHTHSRQAHNPQISYKSFSCIMLHDGH
jgi:hypothetical protein